MNHQVLDSLMNRIHSYSELDGEDMKTSCVKLLQQSNK